MKELLQFKYYTLASKAVWNEIHYVNSNKPLRPDINDILWQCQKTLVQSFKSLLAKVETLSCNPNRFSAFKQDIEVDEFWLCEAKCELLHYDCLMGKSTVRKYCPELERLAKIGDKLVSKTRSWVGER